MKLLKEFGTFINKGNVVDLSVAVVIGGAFGKIVSAIVSDLVMPLVNGVLPQGDWRKWEATPLHFRVGDFFGTVIDFVIVAFVVFLVMVKVMGAAARLRRVNAAVAPETKPCPECLEAVPAAARRCRACTSVFTVLALVLTLLSASGVARAADGPAPSPAPAPVVAAAPCVPCVPPVPPPPLVEWKTQLKGGLLYSSGNSQTTSAGLSLTSSRKTGGNKFSIEGAYNYGRSNIRRVSQVDPTDNTIITGVGRETTKTTDNWLAKARYDRFFTPNNTGFVAAQAAADAIAGKSFAGGGQLGYSRQLIKDAINLLIAEIGYDYSHESYVEVPGKTLDPVSIHSARVFVGETLKLSPETGANASVEALFNVNKEGNAVDVKTNMPGVAAFHDTRVTAKIGLTTTVRKSLSVALGFTLRYDQNPSVLPIPAGAPAGAMYDPSVFAFAETVDTMAEATLVYTFL